MPDAYAGYGGNVKKGATVLDINKYNYTVETSVEPERKPSLGLFSKKTVTGQEIKGSFDVEYRGDNFLTSGEAWDITFNLPDGKVMTGPIRVTSTQGICDPQKHFMVKVDFQNNGAWTSIVPATPS